MVNFLYIQIQLQVLLQ